MSIALEIEILFKLFFWAVCFDFITGVVVAAKNGKLRSRTCSDGLFRSIGEICILTIAILLEMYAPVVGDIIYAIMLGFLFKEGLSICENLAALGVWMPEKLIQMLEVGKDKADKGGK